MLVTVIVLLILSLVGNQFGANLSTRTATNDYGLPSCPGTSSLANITPSPVFERDHTLFFRYDSVLWRSTTKLALRADKSGGEVSAHEQTFLCSGTPSLHQRPVREFQKALRQ